MVGASGFEPPTSWSRRRRYKTSKCRIWCRLRDSTTIYPALEVDGSWTETIGHRVGRVSRVGSFSMLKADRSSVPN